MDEELFGKRDAQGNLIYGSDGRIIREAIGSHPKAMDVKNEANKAYRSFVNHTPADLYAQGFNQIKIVNQMSRAEINRRYPGLLASGNFAYINPQYFHARKMKFGDKIEVTSGI